MDNKTAQLKVKVDQALRLWKKYSDQYHHLNELRVTIVSLPEQAELEWKEHCSSAWEQIQQGRKDHLEFVGKLRDYDPVKHLHADDFDLDQEGVEKFIEDLQPKISVNTETLDYALAIVGRYSEV